MIIQCEQLCVELKHGSLLELDGACGNKLTCVSGTIWVTQYRLRDDWVLQPGQVLSIKHPGKIVVSACHESATFSMQQGAHGHVKCGAEKHTRLTQGARDQPHRSIAQRVIADLLSQGLALK